jgi:hypothetical protein
VTALLTAVLLGAVLTRLRMRLARAGRRYDQATRAEERLERLAQTDPDVQEWRRLNAEKRAEEARAAAESSPRWDGNVRVIGGCSW